MAMTHVRATTPLFALVLMLVLAACGLVATRGHTVPSAEGGVIGVQAIQDQGTRDLGRDDFYTGMPLSEAGTTASLPYVPSAPSVLQLRSSCHDGMHERQRYLKISGACLCEDTHRSIMHCCTDGMQCHV